MTLDAWRYETWIRLTAFLGVFVCMALWEWLRPRRPQAVGRTARWPSNLGIVAINTVLVRLVLPMSAVAWADIVAQNGFGLLHWIVLPGWLAAAIAFVLLDLAIYLQHLLFHSVPMLWRLHRMHHADTEFDVTNGLRFHPLEIMLSMGIKFAAIALLGAPGLAVLVFEVVLNATSIFNHANVDLPQALDRQLRRWVVTPDMHRVHHSVVPRETHSNFGFNLPWWDHVFRTYRAQPEQGHQAMQLGLPIFRDPAWLRLDRLLVQPWAGNAGPTRRDLRTRPPAAGPGDDTNA
jgi:sterol desaturase/sphingolipid hydroxylase (fatty acid hydroxylase superfamily)